MNEPLNLTEKGITKADAVADAINTLLQNLVSKCTKSDGIRDYYHVGLIGYGGMGVGTALKGPLSKKEMVPIGLLGNTPIRIEKRTKIAKDARGQQIERQYTYPVWFEATAGGGTPMRAAFERATTVVKAWLYEHPNCFPPIVINITDGDSTDGDPWKVAQELMGLTSTDGNVLLFNIHISQFSQEVIAYPDNASLLEDDFARDLFKMTSTLTPYMRRVLADEGFSVTENSKGLVVHADFSLLIRFLDIGTRPANLR